MNVSAVLVTRGDVAMEPVVDSLPTEWEIVVWDNSDPAREDLGVYGRYAAIHEAKHDLIYVQDDDCIVSDPQAITDNWEDGIVANMSPHHQERYSDSCLIGFGACFHRDAPARAFDWFYETLVNDISPGISAMIAEPGHAYRDWYRRTCDVVFTTLTSRTIVDIPYVDREFASDSNRMWKQPAHFHEREQMLNLVRRIRDLTAVAV